jgi:hypothetical protein
MASISSNLRVYPGLSGHWNYPTRHSGFHLHGGSENRAARRAAPCSGFHPSMAVSPARDAHAAS